MMEEGQKMKRIRFFAAALVCLFMVNIMPVTASDEVNLPKVVDNAELLTEEEEAELTGLINTIVTEYETDVVLVTENQRQETDIQAEADMLFDSNGYGIGEEKDGVLFLVDMGAGEWSISTHGNTINLLTDYDINSLGETAARGYFSNGKFGAGFKNYLESLATKIESRKDYLAQSQSEGEESTDAYAGNNQSADNQTESSQTAGNQTEDSAPSDNSEAVNKTPPVRVETPKEPKSPVKYIIPALILGLIISAVYMAVIWLKMKTAYKQENADVYKCKNTSARIRKNEVLLTSDLRKVPIIQESRDTQENYSTTRYQESSKHQKQSKYKESRTTVHTSRSGEKHGGASGSFTQEKPKESTTVHTSRNGEKHGGGSGKF